MIICLVRGDIDLRISFGIISGFIAATLFAATGNRQVTENSLSPTAETSVTLGGHKITIEYNAPSARGRQVEGGLIPYDRWYRLGADAATTITSDAVLSIGDVKTPKGVHTLFLYATADKGWKLIVNKQTHQWGLAYDGAQDLGSAPLKLSKLGSPVETFKLTLTKTSDNAAVLAMEWGTTKAEVPVKL
jgi:hypothetical protein